MRKIVLLILLLLTYSLSYGQAIDCVGNAGDTVCQSGSFRIDERLRLKSLPNTHALGVLTTNAQGLIILDTLDAATGVSIEILTDTSDAIHSWVWSIVSNPTIDSYLYATRAFRVKGDDSVAALVLQRVKYNDTNAMLANYAIEAQMLGYLGLKVAYADSGNAYYSVYGVDTAKAALRTSIATKQDALGYTPENVANKVTSFASPDNTTYPTTSAVNTLVSAYKLKSDSTANDGYTRRDRAKKAIDSVAALIPSVTGYLQLSDTVNNVSTRSWRQKAVDSLNILIAAKGTGTVTSVATGYGVSGGPITTSGTVVADTATLFAKYTTTLGAGSGISISGRTITATGGGGTVTNVIGGTNISITGTSTIQPTVNITGTIAVANGGTGTTATTSVNTTPITYGSNNTITVPIATGVTGLGTGVATWAATPSSANLASALTDETGSGLAVFATKPTFTGTIHPASAVAASAFDGSAGNYFTRTLTSSQTFTQSNFSTGQNFIVVLTQGSGTTYNPTWWSGITWVTSGGTAPTMTTTSNGITTYGFTCTGSNTFLGYLVGTQ